LNQLTITEQHVKDAISHINPSKASRPDLLHPRLLKEGAPVLSKPLSTLFNLSLQKSGFPSSWKEANITAILKK